MLLTEEPTLILGTFADAKSVKTRSTYQLVIEIPIEDADRALRALGGVPQPGNEKSVSIVRFTEMPKPEAAQATPAELPTDEPIESEEQSDAEIDRLTQDKPAERRQMTAANVAGMLTHDVRFQTFLDDVYSATWMKHTREGRDDAEQADIVLKELCGVESKTQFDQPGSESERRWRAMHAEYDLWCRT